MANIPYEKRSFNRKNKTNYDTEYARNNFDRLSFVMPKGTKDKIKEAAAKEGLTISEWTRDAIEAKLNG